MSLLEARSGVQLLTGPPQGVRMGGDGVALSGASFFMEGGKLLQVNERDLVSSTSPINSIESIQTRAKVEEMRWNNDLQGLGLMAVGGVIVGLVDTKIPITRRNFLKASALLALLTASCAPEVKPFIYPTPTPSKDKYPPPIPDAEYQKLSNRARITKLVSGNIPESWKNLGPRDLMSAFEVEIRKVLFPEICSFFGCSSQDINANLHFAYTKEDMVKLLLSKGKTQEEAVNIANDVIGITVDSINTSTGQSAQRYIAIQYEENIKIWEKSQKELVDKYPNTSYLKERGFINASIIEATIDTVIHEIIHYIQDRYKELSQEESERLKKMYSGRISEKGRSITSDKFIYTHGAQLNLRGTDGLSYKLNEDLLESFRAYMQEYALESLSEGAIQNPAEMIHKLSGADKIQAILLKNLHESLSISPSEFISTYRDKGFLALVDLYREKALNIRTINNEKIILSDEDIAEIFITLSQSDNEYTELFKKNEYKLGKEFEIATKYWTKIKLLLDSKKTKANIEADQRVISETVFTGHSLQLTLQPSYS